MSRNKRGPIFPLYYCFRNQQVDSWATHSEDSPSFWVTLPVTHTHAPILYCFHTKPFSTFTHLKAKINKYIIKHAHKRRRKKIYTFYLKNPTLRFHSILFDLPFAKFDFHKLLQFIGMIIRSINECTQAWGRNKRDYREWMSGVWEIFTLSPKKWKWMSSLDDVDNVKLQVHDVVHGRD